MALLCCLLSGCLHYRAHSLQPTQSEAAYKRRDFTDPGLTAFARSVRGTAAAWPPKTLDFATASLIAAYFNPSVTMARAQLHTAEASMVAAGARPNPAVSALGGYETVPGSPVVFRFELSLPIETAHKRTYRILEAAKLADASQIGVKEAGWRVYSQVRDAWMDHQAALDTQQALRREAQVRAGIVSLVGARLSVGEAGRPQLDMARADESRVILSLKATDGQVSETLIRLAGTMGVPESALASARLVFSNSDSPKSIQELPITRVQQKGLLNRLDIQRSLLEYAAAEARLQLEIARQYPDVQLNPGYDFDEGFHKFTFGPTVPIPAWNRNRGAIAEADARRSEAEARFLALQAQAIGEMERALVTYRSTLAAFQEVDQRWNTIQAGRERATVRAVQLGEEDRLVLSNVQLEGVSALRARLEALAKSRAAFSALEDAVQAPLSDVPLIQQAGIVMRKRDRP